MKTKVAIISVACILWTFSALGESKEDNRIKAYDKEWLVIEASELYHLPNLFWNKDIYFELNSISFGQGDSSWAQQYIGKSFLSFNVSPGKGAYGQLWIQKSKKELINILYDLCNGKYAVGVYAKVERKKPANNPSADYRYFIIVRYLTKLENSTVK